MKSRMRSKFGQVRPRTAVLAELDHFIIAGNKEMHKSLGEFEF